MLRGALREYVAHHHLERNHQGLGNALITPCSAVGARSDYQSSLETRWHPELLRTNCRLMIRAAISNNTGLLNYYERAAA